MNETARSSFGSVKNQLVEPAHVVLAKEQEMILGSLLEGQNAGAYAIRRQGKGEVLRGAGFILSNPRRDPIPPSLTHLRIPVYPAR